MWFNQYFVLYFIFYTHLTNGFKLESIKWNTFLNEIYQKHKLSDLLQIKEIQSVNDNADETPKTVCSENNEKVIISGAKLKSSNINSFSCNGYEPTTIEIFASDAIIFDKNIDLKGFYGFLSIVAPIWIVKNQTEINLNGKPATAVTPSKANIGLNGIPGNPGNTAGSFFGSAGKFVNGKNLKILASGSDGSKGQEGGDGAEGRRGNDADVENHLYDCYKHTIRWHCKGAPGGPGGNGGDGGVGGFGGLAGKIILMSLENVATAPKYVNENGNKGLPGAGGKGGQGGLEGDAWEGEYFLGWSNIRRERSGTIRADSGNAGVSGKVTVGVKQPKPQIEVNDKLENVINDYKNFLGT